MLKFKKILFIVLKKILFIVLKDLFTESIFNSLFYTAAGISRLFSHVTYMYVTCIN